MAGDRAQDAGWGQELWRRPEGLIGGPVVLLVELVRNPSDDVRSREAVANCEARPLAGLRAVRKNLVAVFGVYLFLHHVAAHRHAVIDARVAANSPVDSAGVEGEFANTGDVTGVV